MLASRECGKGKPLILLHAFPLNSRMWEGQISQLSQKFRVVAPDLPGFGKSSVISDISMAEMAREVAKVLDSLSITESVILAGLSMGGYVAFEFLRQFPQRLGALCLFSTRATPDTDLARENRFKSIEAMERFGLEPFAKKAVKSQLGKTSQEKNSKLIETVLNLMKENSALAAIAAQKAMAARRDSTDLLATIHFPTLILAGEEDEISPPAEMRVLHEKIKNSQFHVLPQAGHLLNLEQSELFNSLLDSFLDTLR